jgi:histidine decarboxylase
MGSQWLTESPLSKAETQRLDAFYQVIQGESELFMGYPCNGIFDYSPLYRFLGFQEQSLTNGVSKTE